MNNVDLFYENEKTIKPATAFLKAISKLSKTKSLKLMKQEMQIENERNETFFLNAKPRISYLRELLEKYEGNPKQIAAYVQINIRLYDVIPEDHALKDNPAVLKSVLHHRPDWYAKMKQEGETCSFTFPESKLNGDDRSMFMHLKKSEYLTAIYKELAKDEKYLAVANSIDQLHLFGNQDYHHDTLYIGGVAFDLEQKKYCEEDVQYTKRPIFGSEPKGQFRVVPKYSMNRLSEDMEQE